MSVEHTLVSVITAGDVGAIQPRLGVSSFDVTASLDTPDELIVHLEAATPPDVIIVESTLFPTVEPIAHLAPDALIIAIGDETPTGAVGHVPVGMSGGAIASLVHALLAGGVGAAVAAVASFEPGAADTKISDRARLRRVSSRSTLITSGAIAASLVAAISWAATRDREAPVRVTEPTPSVASPAITPPVVDPAPPRPTQRPAEEPERAGPRSERPNDAAEVAPDRPGRGPAPGPPPHAASDDDGREPRGKHLGWEHKPPKHDDQGGHGGWE